MSDIPQLEDTALVAAIVDRFSFSASVAREQGVPLISHETGSLERQLLALDIQRKELNQT